MTTFPKIICASLVLTSLACSAPLWAGDGERGLALQINKANGLLRDGDVDAAIGAYRRAQELGPESEDLSYNTAVAQYRKGDVSAAEHLFQQAATTDNDSLAARARYNLGNCQYASALQVAEKDRPAAIQRLESAITNYRSALDVDPSDADARANIELASRLIDKLQEEQKQQQQKQQQQSNDRQQNDQQQQELQDKQNEKDNKQQQDQKNNGQQKQDKPQQKNEQQDSRSQSSQGGEQQKDQKQENKSSDNQKSDQQKQDNDKDQSKNAQSNAQPSKDQESQKQKDSAQQDEQRPKPENQSKDKQLQQQTKSQPSQPRPQPPDAASSADEAKQQQGQKPPQGELSAAGEETKDGKDNKPIAAFDPAKDGEMTKQEAEKMLQAIRDRDLLRRLRRQAAERNQHVPVDRDW